MRWCATRSEYLVGEGRRVFLDLEHFFDGYRHDRDYGLRVLEAALAAGADVGVLCDTNGGMLPMGVHRVVTEVLERSGGARLGIHCQDDTGCAVANTLAAVEAGATHVQCTANGYGERTGQRRPVRRRSANLETKLDLRVLPAGRLTELVRVSHALAEMANIAPDTHQAYVGVSAFAHKAGLHASAIKVSPDLYNHLDPTVVGNDMRVLVTEMAGRASIELKGRELGYDLADDRAALGARRRAGQGARGAGATRSRPPTPRSSCLLREVTEGERRRYFTVESWRTIVEQRADGQIVSEATVKVFAKGQRIVATGEGNGPVNALDNALRQALGQIFPELAALELVDYKVRILEGSEGTGAVTRVLVESTDGRG